MASERSGAQGDCGARAALFAEAIRAGLEKEFLWEQTGNLGSSLLAKPAFLESLHALGEIIQLPPVARPGRFARLILGLRRLTKALLNPWLDQQTRFNRSVIEALEKLHTETRSTIDAWGTSLCERFSRQHEALLNREPVPAGNHARPRLRLHPPHPDGFQEDHPPMPAAQERILERIFVQTRLPLPPARVLVLGCAQASAPIEMASLGYQVSGVDWRPAALHHPCFTFHQTAFCPLPFPDETFDVAVSISALAIVGLPHERHADRQAVDEAHRVLRPGGRFLLTLPFGRAATTAAYRVYDRARLELLLQPFGRPDLLYGVREGQHWTATVDARAADNLDSSEQVNALALVAVEKSACTC